MPGSWPRVGSPLPLEVCRLSSSTSEPLAIIPRRLDSLRGQHAATAPKLTSPVRDGSLVTKPDDTPDGVTSRQGSQIAEGNDYENGAQLFHATEQIEVACVARAICNDDAAQGALVIDKAVMPAVAGEARPPEQPVPPEDHVGHSDADTAESELASRRLALVEKASESYASTTMPPSTPRRDDEFPDDTACVATRGGLGRRAVSSPEPAHEALACGMRGACAEVSPGYDSVARSNVVNSTWSSSKGVAPSSPSSPPSSGIANVMSPVKVVYAGGADKPFEKGVADARLALGSPVTFFIETRPEQQFGRLRAIAPNGTYLVELVGGQRLAGLDVVTPCSEENLRKKSLQLQAWSTDLKPCCIAQPRDMSPPREPCKPGQPVSFEHRRSRLRCFGRVRHAFADGSFVVDLVNGGCVTGVTKVARCSENDLEREARKCRPFRVPCRVDDRHSYVDQVREQRSLSPEIRSPRSARGSRATAPEMVPLDAGTAVSFTELTMNIPRFGRIRSYVVGKFGTLLYTIELAEGGLKVGVEESNIQTISEQLFASEVRKALDRRKSLKTAKDPYASYTTPNAYPSAPNSPRAIAPDSPLSTLRGVAIARVVR